MDRAGAAAFVLLASLAIVAGGCGDGGTPVVDGGATLDARHADGPDSAGRGSALELEWRTKPRLGDAPKGPWAIVITDMTLSLQDVRVVGDAATLTRAAFVVAFDPIEEAWPVLRFAPALPGLYARLVARVVTYEVHGSLEVGDERREFVVVDEPPAALTFDVPLGGVELEPGKTSRARLDVRIGAALDEVNWAFIEPVEGVLMIDGESEQIRELREDLVERITRG